MSLDKPSRLANWPSVAVRAVLILAVFFGLNWYVKNQRKQQAQQAQQSQQAIIEAAAIPAPSPDAMRDGVAIVFVWDVDNSDEQAWRDAAAASLYHQLQRLTRHAGQHSQQPLRVGLLTRSQKPFQTTQTTEVTELPQPSILLPADAPSANEDIEQMLAGVEPGEAMAVSAIHVEIRNQLNRTALRSRHVVLLTSKPNAAADYDVSKDLPIDLHVITASADVTDMDRQMKKVLDEIFKVAPAAEQESATAVPAVPAAPAAPAAPADAPSAQ